jgi:hypothetical protein
MRARTSRVSARRTACMQALPVTAGQRRNFTGVFQRHQFGGARSLFKSYTKDLSFQIFELVFQHRLADMLLPTAVPLQCYDLEHTREYAYCYS